MDIKEGNFEGLKGLKIYYQASFPKNPKAVVQIIHGGFEHTRRYKKVIEKLVSENFIVYINDHRGHGKSDGKRNHITSFSQYAVDCYTLTKIIKKDHGELPFFLLGHSMGSFVAQRYALEHQNELKGLVLSGTGTGTYPLSKYMQILARIMAKLLPTFSAASGFDPNELSTDPESVEDYISDPLINYKTASAAYGVAFMNHYPEIKSKVGSLKIPILIQRGSDDIIVIGEKELIDDLKTEDLTVKIYPKAKHEMYTETKEKREKAFNDLIKWLEEHI